jgi:hypothetical protein
MPVVVFLRKALQLGPAHVVYPVDPLCGAFDFLVEIVDKSAAAYMLQSYLDSKRK